MELFRAEKIATVMDQASKTCRFCHERLRHVRAIVISDTGAVIHMFECRCESAFGRTRPYPKILRIVPGKTIETALSPPHVSKRH